MFVVNKRGSGGLACPCGSWLKHWIKSTGIKPIYCATVMCFRTADLGGHILKAGSYDRGEYIVPLCDWCHRLEEEFEISAILVPAGEQAFCRLAPGQLLTTVRPPTLNP